MNSKIKLVGSAVGAMALLTPAVAAALPVEAQAVDVSAVVAPATDMETAAPAAVPVQGTFSYDQNATTSTQAIAEVFNKAATALCAGLPQYEVDAQGRAICVKSPGAAFSATVEDMVGEEGASNYVIGCSCASNGPGGGAVMNADVSGVTLAALAAMAQA
ncbi:hypothetical protein VJ923_10765 [Adlercreutzia sp. R25]|uniref:Uncharacterized protein n=1 Tax=Adlercreutzia shanghongiae TaxID=3111773 RepID=A0ABU6IWI0_9ACTN|nr:MULTISPECIES: hypothetical protein [unclassified Adlercreutzia]MEC4273641.1 hypothetical protein [Adlercreutzia sp. R25]MEC4294073.1 hypothetical protein [Adlercreutzia sp. R22]